MLWLAIALPLWVYIFGGHFWDYEVVRWQTYLEARAYANSVGKPLLNVGCGLTDWGDVNLDMMSQPVSNFVLGDAQSLPMFGDKQFGAIIASHVLEHLDDPAKALDEWSRVADEVFIATPSWWNIYAWATPEHKWMFPWGINGPWVRIR